MTTLNVFSITGEAYEFINSLQLAKRPSTNSVESEAKPTRHVDVTLPDNEDDSQADYWLKIGNYYLHKSDKEILEDKSKWLNDNHILCAQVLLKKQFPYFHGLQPTILQKNGPFKGTST